MSYKEKFNASEGRALSQLVATKILSHLNDLRAKVQNSPTVPRRWVWELIQNAKDVHSDGGVKIQIEFGTTSSNPHVTFKHTGKPFTAENIRFIIEQISTKDRKKDEEGKRKTTGKFGTGFLTTHLLSEIVTIEGIAKEPDLDYRKFVLQLDRTGYEPDDITDAILIAKKSVEDLDSFPPYTEYVEGEFNTVFRYPLQDEVNIKVADEGSADIENCLPYALVFVSEIESVHTFPNNRVYRRKETVKQLTESIKIVSVTITDQPTFHTLILTKDYTNIVIPVKKEDDAIAFVSIAESVPRLFCDFPLIGTEKFPFPVIINNPHFNPTDPRDGIFLTNAKQPGVEENKSIMLDAVELYFQLLEFASENGFKNLHVLAQIHSLGSTSDMDTVWFKKEILDPIRNKLLYTPIVNAANNDLATILNAGNPYMWFPTASKKEIRDQIWTAANFWFPNKLPKQSEVELWEKLSWSEFGKLTVTKLAELVAAEGDLETLSSKLGKKDALKWLNDFYKLIALETKEYPAIIVKLAIFPNQNGEFCLKGNLYVDDGNIGKDFKDILKLLGDDIRGYLADELMEEGFAEDRTLDQAYAVKEIISGVNEKANDRQIAKSFMPAFRKLLVWFNDNPGMSEKLFPTVLRQKHLLYDDDEIMANITKNARLDDLMKEFNIDDMESLRDILEKKQSGTGNLLPVTQEILASMGIQSAAEWAEAIQDKNLQELFKHDSTPTTDMYLLAQSLIEQAKANVIAHLGTLENYDISGNEQTAKTVLAGILKDGLPISIVVRPAYSGEVIIYYTSEQDVLDYERSELWVDAGNEIRLITLCHILKKAQIKKFPI